MPLPSLFDTFHIPSVLTNQHYVRIGSHKIQDADSYEEESG